MKFITENFNQITLIITVITGCFAFIKWLDSRNLKLKNERYQQYIKHISILSGSTQNAYHKIAMTEQIASVWFLIEYKEYYKLTLRILDNNELKNMSNNNWKNFVLPEIEKVINEIKLKTKSTN